MAHLFNIACLQTEPAATMDEAIDGAVVLAKQAVGEGAQFLSLPEYCGGLRSDGARLIAPSDNEENHKVLLALREQAAALKVWIQVGSVAISGPDGKVYNRGFMIDDAGNIMGRYDKIHLFDVNISESAVYRESDTVIGGNQLGLTKTPFGTVGHTICYDLRFPGLYRDLAKKGADILTCPAAFTKVTGEAHWKTLNQARAIENTRYMVSACAVGEVPGGGACYGHSQIIDPWGNILADGGDRTGFILAQIDLDLVAETARRIPSLDHDRAYLTGDVQIRSAA